MSPQKSKFKVEKSARRSARRAQQEMQYPQWIQPEEGVWDAYSNMFYLNWTASDVRILFGQIIQDPQSQPPVANWVIEERAAITMTWVQAKLLRDALTEAVNQYERINGELMLPKLPEGA